MRPGVYHVAFSTPPQPSFSFFRPRLLQAGSRGGNPASKVPVHECPKAASAFALPGTSAKNKRVEDRLAPLDPVASSHTVFSLRGRALHTMSACGGFVCHWWLQTRGPTAHKHGIRSHDTRPSPSPATAERFDGGIIISPTRLPRTISSGLLARDLHRAEPSDGHRRRGSVHATLPWG